MKSRLRQKAEKRQKSREEAEEQAIDLIGADAITRLHAGLSVLDCEIEELEDE